MKRFHAILLQICATSALLFHSVGPVQAAGKTFQIEEASIEDLHRAIQKRQTTCQQIVQAYVDRARAYNGACRSIKWISNLQNLSASRI